MLLTVYGICCGLKLFVWFCKGLSKSLIYDMKKPRITPGPPYVVIVAKRLRKYGREVLIEGAQAGGDAVLLRLAGLRSIQVGPELLLADAGDFF